MRQILGRLNTTDRGGDDLPPWKFAASSFQLESAREKIAGIINEAWEQQISLTLVTEVGRVFSGLQLVSLAENTLRIERPREWGENSGPFRVFLRSSKGRYFFFSVVAASLMGSCLAVQVPEALFVLQRRSQQRVKLPQGSVAILRKDGRLLDALYVRDISPSGMLFCTSAHADGIEANARFYDIVIAIPAEGGRRRQTLPPIDQGQVVRSFFEAESHICCHAVAFNYESGYIRDALRRLPLAQG